MSHTSSFLFFCCRLWYCHGRISAQQEPRNERNDAADRSGRDVPLPTGTQVSLPSEAPPGSGQQFALPDRKMPIVAKVSSGTFKGEGAGNGAGNGAGVANLQQALQQARRKRELQQEAEAAAASAADALALATGPTRDAAAFETKEVPDEGDSAQLRSQGVSKRNTVQGERCYRLEVSGVLRRRGCDIEEDFPSV